MANETRDRNITITQDQLRVILIAVEYGYRQCEKGQSLEAALTNARRFYQEPV